MKALHMRSSFTTGARPQLRCARAGLPFPWRTRPLRQVPLAFKEPQPQSWNPVEVVKREAGLQSNKLPAPLREAVSSAVEELRFRVTVGDVAARAGVKVQEADDALKALAYDSQATLEVGGQGDVVYTFPRDFQGAIRARSALLTAQPALRALSRGAAYLGRVAFGTALFVSVAVVWAAITVLMLSGRRDDDRRGGGGGGGGRVYYGDSGMRLYFNLADLFTFWDPGYGASNHARVAEGEQLSFVESIFSFVFGDGDPNADFDARRWAALGRLIQARGGVVTAEEMAPFLEPPEAPEPSATGLYKDESFVLPALIRFGGEPEVDHDTGAILYRFPALQASGVTSEWVRERAPASRQPDGGAGAPAPVGVALEQSWELTAAPPGSVFGVVALGLFNLVGVVTLASMLKDPYAMYALREWGLGWVGALLPGLAAYAAAFFAVPAVRALANAWRNAAVEARNGARRQAARLLQEAAPGGAVRRKLQAARKDAATRTIRQGDVVFSTAKETGQQMNEAEMSDWDRQFTARSSAQAFPRSQPLRQDDAGSGRAAPAPPSRPAAPPSSTFRSRGGASGARTSGRKRDFDGRWE